MSAMTDVDICNQALALLGHDRTVSAVGGSDTSAESARCALFYPAARDAVLASFSWEFACRDVPVTTAPYTLPADCLRFVSVRDSSGVVPATRAGGVVTAARAGTLRYVSNAVEVSSIPRHVVDAIVAELAFRLFGPIVGNTTSKDQMEVQHGFASLAQERLSAARDAEIEEHAYSGAPSASALAELDVVNRALSVLGSDRTVWSLEKDPSAEAVRCRQLLPMAVRQVLSAHPWEFARKTAAVASDRRTPPDFVRLVSAVDADGRPVACRIQAGLVEGGAASISYVSSAVPVSAYPTYVADAVVLVLAALLSSYAQGGEGGGSPSDMSSRAEEAVARAIRTEIDEAMYRATPADASAVARTDIANRALAVAGSGVVLKDIDTDVSAEANRCRQFLPVAIRTTLQAHDWDFATECAPVPLCMSAGGWARIEQPAGCVRLVGVSDAAGHALAVRRSREGILVRADGVGGAVVRYVSEDVDVADFPRGFAECVVYRLAALMSGALAKSASERAELMAMAERRLAATVTEESNETAVPGEWENPFLKARR